MDIKWDFAFFDISETQIDKKHQRKRWSVFCRHQREDNTVRRRKFTGRERTGELLAVGWLSAGLVILRSESSLVRKFAGPKVRRSGADERTFGSWMAECSFSHPEIRKFVGREGTDELRVVGGLNAGLVLLKTSEVRWSASSPVGKIFLEFCVFCLCFEEMVW